MRRAALAAVVAVVATATTACSSLPGFGDEEPVGPAITTEADSGPVPTSQQFDRPFPVSGDGWDATVTMSNLRIITSYVYTDAVVVVDVRAVQAAGQPVIDPGDFRAFDPAGRQFERIEYPKGTVDDPLIRSQLANPGEEVQGMVAWTMPRGTRIGRIDLVTPGTIGSVTVTRQPVDPMVTPRADPAQSGATG